MAVKKTKISGNSANIQWNVIQGLLVVAAAWVVGLVLRSTVVLIMLVPVLWIAVLVVLIVMAVKAYQGKTLRLPILAEWADKIVQKV